MSTRRPRSAKKKSDATIYYVVGAVVAALVVAGILIAVSMSGGDDGAEAADSDTIAAIQDRVDGIPADGLVLGDPDAPVTIAEYSDIACIHCRTAAIRTVPAVIEQLVRDGEAKLEYVPTAFISASSERGALGVLAAARQDAAWPFAEALFHMQGNAASDWLSEGDMEAVAAELGLDVDAWREAYSGTEVEEEFLEARDRIQAAGVQSTPTFVVSGPGGSERIEGAVPASDLIAAVGRVAAAS